MYYINWWLKIIYSVLNFSLKITIFGILLLIAGLYFVILLPLLPYYSKSKTYFGFKPLWKIVDKLGNDLDDMIF